MTERNSRNLSDEQWFRDQDAADDIGSYKLTQADMLRHQASLIVQEIVSHRRGPGGWKKASDLRARAAELERSEDQQADNSPEVSD